MCERKCSVAEFRIHAPPSLLRRPSPGIPEEISLISRASSRISTEHIMRPTTPSFITKQPAMNPAAIAMGRDTPSGRIDSDLSLAESPLESTFEDSEIDTQQTSLPGEPSDVFSAGRWDSVVCGKVIVGVVSCISMRPFVTNVV